jgi:hypothetical protein
MTRGETETSVSIAEPTDQAHRSHTTERFAAWDRCRPPVERLKPWWPALGHVCGILAQLGEHRSAAVLYRAIATAGAAIALPFEPSDAERLGGLVEELRAILGAAEFAAAVREGAATGDVALVQFVQNEIGRLTNPSIGARGNSRLWPRP